jgi:hypothetical protein
MLKKMRLRRPLKFLLIGMLATLGTNALPSLAQADKFDFSLGYFSLTTQQTGSSTAKSGNASGLGEYQVLYRHTILPSFEVGLGYTLMVSKGLSGDLGYGVDVSGYWFPFTLAGYEKSSSEGASEIYYSIWRPYVTAGFFQRQFQAIQTGYAGLGGGIGVERALTAKFSLRGEFRDVHLGGSSTSSANTTDFLIGVSLSL